MQTLLTVLAVIAGLVLAAFGLGRTRGKSAAETKAAAERASVQAEASEKHIEVLRNAVDVQQDITSQSDAAVSERLRQKWRREGE
ncbi:hypothetical protein RM156_12625 [Pantoea agglomerans]|uniref:hypothetical protein n=1 Tax=Enterobacter agglomerans TaxID=549 RepID=UPI0028A08855|nr:hypothetical protein [Pantoea agglomerans]WNK65725.1 hypothetical protein RM156_12625 [Pantoea agglomerans]